MSQKKSRSDSYLESKTETPSVSAIMANSVSHYRKAKLAEEVEQGLFKDGSSSNKPDDRYSLTNSSIVLSSVGRSKIAQVVSGGGYGYAGGTGNTVKQSPEIYSPLWLNSNISLPRDRATINAWCRAFFALNPFVHNAISLHSTYPISKISIKCPHKEAEQFFNEMCEEIDLMNILVQIAQEYWLLGEAFVYAEMDETKGKWNRLMLQNPDYMLVKRSIVANEPVIMLRPDNNLKNIVFSKKPSDIEQRRQLNPHIIDSVKRGDNITLDNLNVSHLARRIAPYEARGTGLPVCIFRQLMLMDKLRESKYAQADNMVNPLTLIKIGGGEYKPTHADIEYWRNVFEEAQYDKDFKIFTHDGVSVERIGHGSGIYDISGDITQLIKEIFIGLQVPSVLMDGGSDTTYANGGVALDVLKQRYMQFRNMLSNWLRRKIFAPISKIQEFYYFENGVKKLIVPDIDWNHMALFDTGDYIQNMVSLTQTQGEEPPRVSKHSLYYSLGLDYNTERRNMKIEQIQEVISKKEKESLEAMDLNKLRALTEDDEIPEIEKPQQEQVPGMSNEENVPGAEGTNPSPMPSI